MIRVFELISNTCGRSRHIRCGHTALLKGVRSHRLVRPINIGLWIVLLGDETVHYAGTLGLFGVEDRFHSDPSLALEVLQDRLRKDLILAHVHDNSFRTRTSAGVQAYREQ